MRTAKPHSENFVYSSVTVSRMSVTESIAVAKFTANNAAEFYAGSLGGRVLQRTAAAHGVPLTPSQAYQTKPLWSRQTVSSNTLCVLEIVSITNSIEHFT